MSTPTRFVLATALGTLAACASQPGDNVISEVIYGIGATSDGRQLVTVANNLTSNFAKPCQDTAGFINMWPDKDGMQSVGGLQRLVQYPPLSPAAEKTTTVLSKTGETGSEFYASSLNGAQLQLGRNHASEAHPAIISAAAPGNPLLQTTTTVGRGGDLRTADGEEVIKTPAYQTGVADLRACHGELVDLVSSLKPIRLDDGRTVQVLLTARP